MADQAAARLCSRGLGALTRSGVSPFPVKFNPIRHRHTQFVHSASQPFSSPASFSASSTFAVRHCSFTAQSAAQARLEQCTVAKHPQQQQHRFFSAKKKKRGKRGGKQKRNAVDEIFPETVPTVNSSHHKNHRNHRNKGGKKRSKRLSSSPLRTHGPTGRPILTDALLESDVAFAAALGVPNETLRVALQYLHAARDILQFKTHMHLEHNQNKLWATCTVSWDADAVSDLSEYFRDMAMAQPAIQHIIQNADGSWNYTAMGVASNKRQAQRLAAMDALTIIHQELGLDPRNDVFYGFFVSHDMPSIL